MLITDSTADELAGGSPIVPGMQLFTPFDPHSPNRYGVLVEVASPARPAQVGILWSAAGPGGRDEHGVFYQEATITQLINWLATGAVKCP